MQRSGVNDGLFIRNWTVSRTILNINLFRTSEPGKLNNYVIRKSRTQDVFCVN